MAELISREAEKAAKVEELAEFIEGMIASRTIIDSAEAVKDRYKDETGEEVSIERVRQVLRVHLATRYRKIINLPIHANTERCRIQR